MPRESLFFALLDFTSGYHQLQLAEESRYLTVFLTKEGLFCYRVMPQGLKVSGDAFNCASDHILAEHISSMLKLIDDLLVHSTSKHELIRRVRAICHTANLAGVTFSLKKFVLSDHALFGGFMVDASSGKCEIKADPTKISALLNWESPKLVGELKSFVGFANQLSTWIPNLFMKLSNLRQLLR